MKLRHILLALAVILAFLFIGTAFYLNEELLATSFKLPFGLSVLMDDVLIFVFLAGILITFLMYRSIRLGENLTWSSNRNFIKALNHLYADRYDEALSEIQRAYRKSGTNYDILMTMGVIFKRLSQGEPAMDCFRRAFQKKPTIQAFLKILETLGPENETDLTSETLTKLVQKLPRESRPAAYRALLDYLKRIGEWEVAFRTYRKGRKEDNTRFPSSEGAELRYELGRKNASLRMMKELIADFPGFAPAYVRCAELLQAEGREEEMLDLLKRGFSNTRIVIFLQMIEDHLLTVGTPERAVEELGQIMLNENHHLLARFYLGKLYYRLEMLEKAREIFENLEGEVEYIPALPHYLARIYFRKGDMRTAFQYMEELVERSNVLSFRFSCDNCHELMDEWSERCPMCRTINSVRMIYEELKSDSAAIFML